MNSADPYPSLWLFLAKAHLRQDGKSDLNLRMEKMDAAKWPVPVLKFYLGEINGRELAAAAVNDDQKTEFAQFCEMNFYVGEFLASRSLRSRAKVRFQTALEFCPRTFIEYEGAIAELKGLGITGSVAK